MKISIDEVDDRRLRIKFDNHVVVIDGGAATWLGQTLLDRARRQVALAEDDPRRVDLSVRYDQLETFGFPHAWPGPS